MNKRLSLAAAALAAAVVVPSVANAAYTTGSVNLRSGPGTNYARLTTVPAGAYVDVYDCSSWCRVSWNGYEGWISGSYVDAGYAPRVERPRYAPRYTYRDRYNDRRYWDGPRYRDRDRYSYYRPYSPGGVYFGFGF